MIGQYQRALRPFGELATGLESILFGAFASNSTVLVYRFAMRWQDYSTIPPMIQRSESPIDDLD